MKKKFTCLLNNCYFYQFINNLSALLSYKFNAFSILNMADFF